MFDAHNLAIRSVENASPSLAAEARKMAVPLLSESGISTALGTNYSK
jgi:hypothetical protein